MSMQEFNYLSTITLDDGKVFALFTKSPTKVCACSITFDSSMLQHFELC